MTAQLIVDGKPFLILGGELHNSSSSSLEYMKPISAQADSRDGTERCDYSVELGNGGAARGYVLISALLDGLLGTRRGGVMRRWCSCGWRRGRTACRATRRCG